MSTGPSAVSGGQVVDPAVVLVEQADLAVVDDERRVAAGPVADRRLDVDGRRSDPRRARPAGRAAVRMKLLEAEARAACAPARRSGSRAAAPWPTGRRARRGRPRRGGRRGGGRRRGSRAARPRPADVGRQLVVAREDEPRAEERGHEPRVAHDRALPRSRSGSRRGRARWRASAVEAAGRSAPGQPTRTGAPSTASATLSGRAGRCTAAPGGRRARSTGCRPSSAARSGPTGPGTSPPAS